MLLRKGSTMLEACVTWHYDGVFVDVINEFCSF